MIRKYIFASAAALALASCGGKKEIIVEKDRIVQSNVPIDGPCKLGAEPAEPEPAATRFTDDEWCDADARIAGLCTGMDLKQKSYAIGSDNAQGRMWGRAVSANAKACR